MFCSKCGAKAIDGAEFCQKCGAKLIKNEAENSIAENIQPDAVSNQGAVPIMGKTENAAEKNKAPAKKISKKRFFIIGAVILVVILIIAAVGGSSEMDYIATVKDYTPFASSQGMPYTCDEVFGRYIEHAVWETFGESDTRNVTVSGTIKGTDIDAAITIKAALDPDDSKRVLMSPVSVRIEGDTTNDAGDAGDILYIFFAAYDEGLEDLSEFKGEMYDLNVLLNSIADVLGGDTDFSQTSGGSGISSVTTSDKLMLGDIELKEIIGMSSVNIVDKFGGGYTADSISISYNIDENYNQHDGWMQFYTDDNDNVTLLTADPAIITYNGQSLDLEKEELVEVLGSDYRDLGGAGNSFGVEWNIDGLVVSIYFPIRLEDGVEDFTATSIDVYLPYETNDDLYDYDYPYGYEDDYPYGYEDDDGYDDNLEYNSAGLDPALVGRWKSYDGGTLEFDSSGSIPSVDFKCWGLRDITPYSIFCYSDNGRVNCTAYFDLDFTYDIHYYEDGREYIEFDNGAVYIHEEGESGELTGYWRNGSFSYLGYQFNEDGTGVYNDKYKIQWYIYTTDDGKKALHYTLLDETYFDYYVLGDTLTVYLSDSSRIYTKVGN